MQYIRWALALTMICGTGYASQVLAESATRPDTDAPGMGDQTKSYVFSSQINDTANRQGVGASSGTTGSSGATVITVIGNDKGQPLTITLTSSNDSQTGQDSPFISSDSTGDSNDVGSWGYFVHSGGTILARFGAASESGPGADLYQVVHSPYIVEDMPAMNPDGSTGQVRAITARDFVRTRIALGNADLTIYELSQSSGPISSGGNFTPGGTPHFASNADDMALVMGANDANDSGQVKKPMSPRTVALLASGIIAAMVLLGTGIAALARRPSDG